MAAFVERCEYFNLKDVSAWRGQKKEKYELADMLVKAGVILMVGKSASVTTTAIRESKLEFFEYMIGLSADPLQKDQRWSNGLPSLCSSRLKLIL